MILDDDILFIIEHFEKFKMASKMSKMMRIRMVCHTVCPGDKMNKNAMLPHNFIRY